VRSMLQDRFRLHVHQQKKETNVYHLVSVQGILKLKWTGDARDATTQMRDAKGHRWATKFDMELLARYLGGELGFPVVDQTGVAGVYDFELVWNPEESRAGGKTDSLPSMVTAIRSNWGWN